MNSARENIREYIKREYPNWIHSGELQRMIFKNRDGTTAMPKIVVRRVQELENERDIAVKYENGSSLYKFIPPVVRRYYITSEDRKQKHGKQNNEMWTIPKEELKGRIDGTIWPDPSQPKLV